MKQAKNQERFLFIPKSYQRIFFKVKPIVKKEVKTVKRPKIKAKATILLLKTFFKPIIASEEVFGPVIPVIKIMKKRQVSAEIKIHEIITFFNFI